MELYKLKYRKNGTIGYLDFVLIYTDNTLDKVEVYCKFGKEKKFHSMDKTVFGAFLKCREKTEKYGIQIICAGCREDAWTSGVTLDIGFGKVIVLYAENEKTANIFSECESDFAVSVAQQKEYQKKRLKEKHHQPLREQIEEIDVEFNGAKYKVELIYHVSNQGMQVNGVLKGERIDEVAFEAHDLFDAFLQVREKLEGKGVKFLCFGARYDVWPSGMSSQMSLGCVAYAYEEDVSGYIFEYYDGEKICTATEQKNYHNNWAKSKLDNVNDEKKALLTHALGGFK